MAAKLTMFTFGYWGWGSATRELVHSIDAVERRRGFRPPIFVDIRMHRAVRAKGFANDVFKRVVGRRRYEWMSELGNRSVIGQGGRRRVVIKSPAAAVKLLDLARKAARERRRVIFFCSCEIPRWCHRRTIATLLLRAASTRGIKLQIDEWPGGEPTIRSIQVPLADESGPSSARLRLASARGLARLAGLPYGTLMRLGSAGADDIVPVGPARYAAKGWYLPVLLDYNEGTSVPGTPRAVRDWRRRYGYGARDA